jgi:hypothetical protein
MKKREKWKTVIIAIPPVRENQSLSGDEKVLSQRVRREEK